MQSYLPILLVDDDEVDTIIIRRVFGELKVTNKIVHKADGEDALGYLTEPSSEKPCIIILDLNMPKMNGFELLKIVKANDSLKRIPIVILTTSTDEHDVIKCFDMGAAGYIVKPANYSDSIAAMKTLDTYWTLSKLPSPEVQIPAEAAIVNGNKVLN